MNALGIAAIILLFSKICAAQALSGTFINFIVTDSDFVLATRQSRRSTRRCTCEGSF